MCEDRNNGEWQRGTRHLTNTTHVIRCLREGQRATGVRTAHAHHLASATASHFNDGCRVPMEQLVLLLQVNPRQSLVSDPSKECTRRWEKEQKLFIYWENMAFM